MEKKKSKKIKTERNKGIIRLFFLAIGKGEIFSVEHMLIYKIVKPSSCSARHGNGLHAALTECPAEKLLMMVKILILGGVNVDSEFPITKDTPLHILAEKTCSDLNPRIKKALAFSLVIEASANTGAKNKNGKRAIDLLHPNTGKKMRNIFSGKIKGKDYAAT